MYENTNIFNNSNAHNSFFTEMEKAGHPYY